MININKLIIKFTSMDKGLVEVTYLDGSTEIVTTEQFKTFSKEQFKMGFIVPKE